MRLNILDGHVSLPNLERQKERVLLRGAKQAQVQWNSLVRIGSQLHILPDSFIIFKINDRKIRKMFLYIFMILESLLSFSNFAFWVEHQPNCRTEKDISLFLSLTSTSFEWKTTTVRLVNNIWRWRPTFRKLENSLFFRGFYCCQHMVVY